MSPKNSLNPRQREAVTHTQSPLLVLAGAGSGKTSVITQKIAYLIGQCDYQAKQIAAVTFTNKAAREMKERIVNLVGKQASRGLTVSTFHTLGLSILRKEHRLAGYQAVFSILDQDDCKVILRDLMQRDFSDDNTDLLQQIQNAISKFKNELLTPEQAIAQAENAEQALFARCYEHYQRMLKAYNAVDFDDLILQPVWLLRQYSEVLTRWQAKIRYLLVDEYQDTNASQYELVRLLVGHRGGLTAVGDDDQSIYAWRGARPENLAQLKQDFPSLTLIKLEQNYRSTGLILNAANQVISHNPHEFEKKLWSDKGWGDPIRILKCASDEAEAERVVNELVSRHLRYSANYSDFAILYRGNHQARLLEIKLQGAQVPYKLSGGTSFFARNEIKDVMAYLRLLINPDDDAALLRVINTPRREIGSSSIEALSSYAQEREINLLAACSELGLEQRMPKKGYQRINQFAKWLEQTRQNLYQHEHLEPLDIIKEMLNDINYEGWLIQNSATPHQAEKRYKNVLFLLDSIEKMQAKAEEQGEQLEIDEAISKLILRDMLEQKAEDEELDQVQLLTLHAAKGLEFAHVYIIGLEEELLPHRNSIDIDAVEEERRLMYVGITRAMRTLTLTYAGKRRQFGETINTTHSRFLDELPESDVQWEGKTEVSEEDKKAHAQATFESLKDLF